MTTGYSLRNTPTLLESIDMFNLNRPKRKSFDQWIADLQALSGKRDVSQDDDTTLTDEQIQAALAADYAAAECADGRAREHNPREIED